MSKKIKIVIAAPECQKCEKLEKEISLLKASNAEWARQYDTLWAMRK